MNQDNTNTATLYKVVTTIREVREYLSGYNIVAWDIETSPLEPYRGEEKAALDPHKSDIVGVSFSVSKDTGIYVPIGHKSGKNADKTEVLAFLAEFAANKNIIKIAHNLAFEAMFLYKHDIILQQPVYDTIGAVQLTIRGTGFRPLADSGLKTLVLELFGITLPSFGQVTGIKHFDELDLNDFKTINYACSDADFTLRLYHMLNEYFDNYLPRHRYIVEQIESQTAVYCGLMKYNGLLVDNNLMTEKQKETDEKLVHIKKAIANIIGSINIGENASTAALKKHLYEDLKIPVLKFTKKFKPALDDETLILLQEWCVTNRPELVSLCKLVQEFREVQKIRSTYISGYKKYINSVTGRIHADLFPLATETGRFAARSPNLQNMPRVGNDDTGVRNFFVAPHGKVLLSCDLSQIELRVGAYYCRDNRMLETYQTGGDIHAQTTSVIYGIPLEEAEDKNHPLYKERRTIAKNCNFGTFYGLFPKGLQKTLKFKAGLNPSLEECGRIISNLKYGYPALGTWQENTKQLASLQGYVETLFGRRRFLPEINSANWTEKSIAERCSLNSPIQGSAADILKLALGRIIMCLPDRPWLRPLLQIHDELVFEIPEDKIQEAVYVIKYCMEYPPFPGFDVPIVAEAAVGKRFGELKEI